MSYCAAATAFIFSLLGKLSVMNCSVQLMVFIGFFLVLALGLIMSCMVLATLTVFPITFSNPSSPIGESMIFYGDISRTGKEEYSESVKKKSDIEFLEDLNGQIYTLAYIVSNKFSRIKIMASILVAHFGCMAAAIIGMVVHYIF